jgi:uncharacterized membrane protein YhhN
VGVAARCAGMAFLASSTVHLAGQLLAVSELHLGTKPLLMPTLLAWFLLATPASRLRTLVGAALALSWLGDLGLMPPGETWFLVGLGAFLLAQLTYAIAFWPWHPTSVVHRPRPLLGYLLVLTGLLTTLWSDLGDLRIPVTVYACVIVAMAVLATGLGRTVALGAALFVLSDALIALGSVTELLDLPRHGFWVMVTYLAAQGLLAWGVREVVLAAADPTPATAGA